MRKIFIGIMSVILVFSLAACSQEVNQKIKSSDSVSKKIENTDVSEKLNKDFNGYDPITDSVVIGEEISESDIEAVSHTAEISVKDYGTITVELDHDAAPITVDNFVKLAEDGFYDGLTFHRIMDGFMIQGGDPLGNGMGGADENIVGEFALNGIENNLSHTRGAISMARSQDYDSASSQFFIVQTDSTFLDGQYAAFGYVTEGMDVVDAICTNAVPTDNNGTIPADEQPIIEYIKISESNS